MAKKLGLLSCATAMIWGISLCVETFAATSWEPVGLSGGGGMFAPTDLPSIPI